MVNTAVTSSGAPTGCPHGFSSRPIDGADQISPDGWLVKGGGGLVAHGLFPPQMVATVLVGRGETVEPGALPVPNACIDLESFGWEELEWPPTIDELGQ